MGSTQTIYMLTIFWGRFRTPRGGPVKQYLQGKPEKSYAPAVRPRNVEEVPLIEFSEKPHVALRTGGNTTFSCFCHVKSGWKLWTIVLSNAEFVELFTIKFHAIYFISMLTFDILKTDRQNLAFLANYYLVFVAHPLYLLKLCRLLLNHPVQMHWDRGSQT